MFKNEREDLVHEAETVIAPSVRVEGDFVSEGNVRIEGSVSGSIATDRDLLVGEKANITANVTALNAIISGEMNGNLKVTEKIELTSTARLFGDIQAKVLSVSPGAILNGRLMIGSEVRELTKEEAATETKAAARSKTVREKKIEEILQQ